jgi:tetratricopeptide (TPR) repeat protein
MQYFARMLRTAAPKMRHGDQVQWIHRLTADNENLIEALRHAIEIASARVSVQMVAALGQYWTMSGRPAEAVGWMQAALDVPGRSSPIDRATALYLLALGRISSGTDPATSIQQGLRNLATIRWMNRHTPEINESGIGLFTDAFWAAFRRDKATMFRLLDTARDHRDPWIRSMGVMMAAMMHENEGEVDQMAADLTVALAGFRELGDRFGTSMALRGLAGYQAGAGQHAEALESLTEALRLIDELGTTEGVGQLLGTCAMSRLELGDADGARADLDRALRLAEESGSRSGQAMAHLGYGRLAERLGNLAEAKAEIELAYSMLDPEAERMAPHGQAMMQAQLGRMAALTGDLDEGRRQTREAVALALTTEDMPLAAAVVEAAAEVDLLDGDFEQAARTLGIAARMKGMRSIAAGDLRRVVDRLHDALGNERYAAAYEAGATLTREEALAELAKRVSSS